MRLYICVESFKMKLLFKRCEISENEMLSALCWLIVIYYPRSSASDYINLFLDEIIMKMRRFAEERRKKRQHNNDTKWHWRRQSWHNLVIRICTTMLNNNEISALLSDVFPLLHIFQRYRMAHCNSLDRFRYTIIAECYMLCKLDGVSREMYLSQMTIEDA